MKPSSLGERVPLRVRRLTRASQFADARRAYHPALKFLEICSCPAEDTCVAAGSQDDSVLLDGDFELGALLESEAATNLRRENDSAEIVDLSAHPGIHGGIINP